MPLDLSFLKQNAIEAFKNPESVYKVAKNPNSPKDKEAESNNKKTSSIANNSSPCNSVFKKASTKQIIQNPVPDQNNPGLQRKTIKDEYLIKNIMKPKGLDE